MSEHPFRAIHADAWAAEPIDIPSLNKEASDLLLARIEDVRRAGAQGREMLRSTSVLLLGPAGSGKTHLFARLRKQTGPRAIFVYNRPEIGIDPSPRHVLAALVRALRRSVIHDQRRQIDLIAGTLLAAQSGAPSHFPFAFLDDFMQKSPEAQRALIEHTTARVEERYPEIWPRYLERLLSVLFANLPDQRALFAWLSGEEPSQIELDRIGERCGLQDIDVLPALRTLGVAASFGAPIVLVFDQLENLIEDGDRTQRIIAHARLVCELRDTVRGLVLVQMALDNDWMSRIHTVLTAGDRARLEETVRHLALPTQEERRQLIERWREALPEEERASPFPHPFSTAEVEKWTRDPGMTPRMLMQACGEAYLRTSTPAAESHVSAHHAPAPIDEQLEAAWTVRLGEARSRINETAQDNRGISADVIRGGLIAALGLLGVKASAVMAKGAPAVQIRHQGIATDVLVAQHAHHSSLASVIRTATEIAAQHPAVLLRERAFAIRPTWKEVERLLAGFAEMPKADFLQIDREDLVRLIALEDLLSAARSQDLPSVDGRPIPYADVMQWASQQLGCSAWKPVATVVRGQPEAVPTTAVEPQAEGKGRPVTVGVDFRQVPLEHPAPLPALSSASATTATASDMEARAEADEIAQRIVEQLRRQGVRAMLMGIRVGPRLAGIWVMSPGQRVAELDRASEEVEHRLSKYNILYDRSGPKRHFWAPRRTPRPVALESLLDRKAAFLRARPGRFVLGEGLDGEALVGDLSDGSSCHLLIGGRPKSGKSVLLRAIVSSLCRFHPPSAIRFTLIDPKRVAFTPVATSVTAHLVGPIIHEAEAMLSEFGRLVTEMEKRYEQIELRHTQTVEEYNESAPEPMARHVVVVDEIQGLMDEPSTRRAFLDLMRRLGWKAHTVGIHLVFASQRLDSSTLPAEIRECLGGRIALKVQDAAASRVLLNQKGAERLLGQGDLFADLGHGSVRAQAPMA